jgi:enoyl-CoA hydratase/carnithine racemase
MPDVHIDDRGAVRTITLDRPGSRNGLTPAVVQELTQAIATSPATCRAIVLTGANGAFCSGADLKEAVLHAPQPGELERSIRQVFHGLIRSLRSAPQPTIAAIDGAAVGFGCDLALACDIRIVSDTARLGETFVKRGLMPDGGATYLLPRIVGVSRALELMLTGELVGADEAVRIGLASRSVPSGELATRAAELADRLAAGPPLAHRMIKQAVYAGLDGDFDAALAREAAGQLGLLASRDFTEGVTAFLQKRDPRFQGS